MAESKKVSELPVAANLAASDRLLVLYNANSTPTVRTIRFDTLSSYLPVSNTVPATANSPGVAGTIAHDGSYIYVCVANNVWKRSALTTW